MSFNTFNLIAHSQEVHKQTMDKPSNSFKVMVVLEAQEDNDLLDGLLSKILAAIKIDLSKDVCLVKKEDLHTSLNILKVIKDLGINKVLSFGLKPKELNLNFSSKFYKPVYSGELSFLFVDSLSILNKDSARKKALWDNLQNLFLNA